MQTIEIRISKDGRKVRIEGENFVGAGCQVWQDRLVEALGGKVLAGEKKAEFHAVQTVQA